LTDRRSGLKSSVCKRRKGGGRKKKYTDYFTIILKKLWAFFSYWCGKILSPFHEGVDRFSGKAVSHNDKSISKEDKIVTHTPDWNGKHF
jgi:hypothetical protein